MVTHVGVAEQLADDQAPAGTEDACDLAQACLLIRDLPEDGDQDGRVEGIVLVWEVLRVALGGVDVPQAALARAADRVIEHLLLEVEDLDRPVVPHPLGQVERVVAGAGADLQDALAGRRDEYLPQPVTGDPGMRRLDPEALAVRARRGVLAPPRAPPSTARAPAAP